MEGRKEVRTEGHWGNKEGRKEGRKKVRKKRKWKERRIKGKKDKRK